MSEEKKEEVKTENAQKQEQPTQPQSTPEAQKAQEETPEMINWRRFREERAKERKQKEEVDRQLKEEKARAEAFKAALESITSKPASQSPHANMQNDFSEEESEDSKIERKVNELLTKKQQESERERMRKEAEELPQTINKHMPDFSRVCSQENCDYFEYHYPEVAQAYAAMPEGFDKWSSLYKAIKRFVPNIDGKKEMAKAEKNLAKPQSASQNGFFMGHGTAQASSARLSEEQKAANWQRMQREMNKI